jgi:FPC/CPF motif-containing protein YcgG
MRSHSIPQVEAASSYAAYRDGRLVLLHTPGEKPTALQEIVHDSFRALVEDPDFVCVGAKSGVHRSTYRMGLYGEMGSHHATASLAHDLDAFVEEHRGPLPSFTSFIASFTAPVAPDEGAFEALLWGQLQALHDRDAHQQWDPSVSFDPRDPAFSFSFAGQAFFVVGLHPRSSRWARRFAWPTLVFNRHDQFESLRRDGRYGSIRDAIRARDVALQGTANPMLSNFGSDSEARQYSGRAVDDAWVCPFKPRHTTGAPTPVGEDR